MASSVLVGYLVTILIEIPFVRLRDRLMPSTYKLVIKEDPEDGSSVQGNCGIGRTASKIDT